MPTACQQLALCAAQQAICVGVSQSGKIAGAAVVLNPGGQVFG
jgi:hypothetical protein